MLTGSRVAVAGDLEEWEFTLHSADATTPLLVDSFSLDAPVDEKALRAIVSWLYRPLGIRLEVVSIRARAGRMTARVVWGAGEA